MFVPAPIDKDFIPYTKRPVLRRNAALFVDGKAGSSNPISASRVVPQIAECAGKPSGTPCGPLYNGRRLLSCQDGECV
jgi:hypothetical protein